jgi:hypothetical protein
MSRDSRAAQRGLYARFGFFLAELIFRFVAHDQT